MNRKLVIPVVAVIAAVAAFYVMVLSPKREEVTRLDAEISKQESAADQFEQQAAAYGKAKANYRANYTTIARLGKAVPADDDVRSLLVQINSAAERSEVSFRALSVAGAGTPVAPGAAPVTGLASAPGAVPVGSGGFSAMPFTFSFSGSFFRLSDFLNRLERFVTVENDRIDVTGRLLLLSSIAVTADSGDLGKLQAQIGAATYIVPPTQAVADAAPATADPAAAADAATVPSAATIRGVR